MADVAYLPGPEAPPERKPLLGFAMVVAAGALWGANGTVMKVILESGPSTSETAELRVGGAALLLVAVLAVSRRDLLHVERRDLLALALFGIAGLTFVQLLYLYAIDRLPIAIALLIQYTAPLMVALYARYGAHEEVRARVWAALALALAGLALVLQVWHGITLDGIGAIAAIGAAVTFALYILLAERGVKRRHPVSLLTFGLIWSTLFWAVVAPWWDFPFGDLGESVSLQGHLSGVHVPLGVLALWMIVLGTVVPFALLVSALRHVSATSAGLVAMLEPVVATVVAASWLGESLTALQVVGGVVVLVATGLAQTAR